MSNRRMTVPPLQEEELIGRPPLEDRPELFTEAEVVAAAGEAEPGTHKVANPAEDSAEKADSASPMRMTGAVEDTFAIQGSLVEPPMHEYVRALAHRTIVDLAAELRHELRLELKSIATATPENGILARAVGGAFDCPKCGLRLISPSLTSQTGGLYEHPFGESSRLGNKQCELKGVKFSAPLVFLQFQKPRPLTAKE